MFAVIQTGGKQYRVEKGSLIRVEKIEKTVGSSIEFTSVLMVGLEHNPKIGTPTVPGARVVAEVVDQVRDRKVVIFKKKRRHNYRRKKGHRQHRTLLKVTEISVG